MTIELESKDWYVWRFDTHEAVQELADKQPALFQRKIKHDDNQ